MAHKVSEYLTIGSGRWCKPVLVCHQMNTENQQWGKCKITETDDKVIKNKIYKEIIGENRKRWWGNFKDKINKELS